MGSTKVAEVETLLEKITKSTDSLNSFLQMETRIEAEFQSRLGCTGAILEMIRQEVGRTGEIDDLRYAIKRMQEVVEEFRYVRAVNQENISICRVSIDCYEAALAILTENIARAADQ